VSDDIRTAAARDERLLSKNAPVLAEMARWASAGNLERLRLGQLYYELTLRNDLSYEAIDTYLVQHHGVQMPTSSTMSRLRKVYEVWHAQAGMSLVDLAPFSPYLLYQVQARTLITSRTAPMWLQRMRTYTREQVLEAAGGMGKGAMPGPDTTEFRTLTVQREVAQLFNDARARFAESVGAERLSPTVFVEFLSQLVLDSSIPSLRNLWAKLHGEEVDG
jgi:hypothetical protein